MKNIDLQLKPDAPGAVEVSVSNVFSITFKKGEPQSVERRFVQTILATGHFEFVPEKAKSEKKKDA